MSYYQLPTKQSLDTISHLSFSPENVLSVCSYDTAVYLFNINNYNSNNPPEILAHFKAPSVVLSMAYTAYRATFAGLQDGTIRHLDLENMKLSSPVLGEELEDSGFSNGINTLKTLGGSSLLATANNGTLWRFDPRARRVPECHKSTSKTITMDASDSYIAISKIGNFVEIYDHRDLSTPLFTRPTGLRYQTTALRIFPSSEGYAVSSIDGRVAVESFTNDENFKFAFKCHRARAPDSDMDTVYPVTLLAFHSRQKALFTCGADGHVSMWSWEKRKRIRQLPLAPSPTLIYHMDLSHDCDLLAIGVCDDAYLRSPDYDTPTKLLGKVFIREINDLECTPKT